MVPENSEVLPFGSVAVAVTRWPAPLCATLLLKEPLPLALVVTLVKPRKSHRKILQIIIAGIGITEIIESQAVFLDVNAEAFDRLRSIGCQIVCIGAAR